MSTERDKQILTHLDELLPHAVAWVREQEHDILQHGVALNPREIQIAQALGVKNKAHVRLLTVDEMPQPQHPILHEAAQHSGFFALGTQGMTLGAGIFIARAAWRTEDLLAHELVHIAQYERLGIEEFLRRYLSECLTVGYWNSPLEMEARQRSALILRQF